MSSVETKSALQREQRFQISGPGEQSAETALSKGLTKEYSLDYRAIYACKQPKTMGKKKLYILLSLELFVNFAAYYKRYDTTI